MSKFRTLVFDLDDTLYPERSFVISGFRAAGDWISSNLGLPAERAAAELLSLHDEGVRRDTFNRWLEAHNLDIEQNLGHLVGVYRRHSPRIEPFPAVPGLLNRLHASYPLGLISDGLHEVQNGKLRALGIENCFDAVVFSDRFGKEAWKPSTKPYEVVLSMLGSAAEESVYIADNPIKDFLGARKLGMRSIRVRHKGGYYSRCEPPTPEHAPDLQVEDIADIERIILES